MVNTGKTTPGLRSEVVRRANLSTILRSLHLNGSLSRSDLVREVGLTRSAVGALVTELGALGLVDEVRSSSDGNRGRPSPLVQPRSDDNVVLAIEILVDSIAVSAVGLSGLLLRSSRQDRSSARFDVEQTVSDVCRLVRRISSSLPSACTVHGVGIAVPGLVRQADQRVVVVPNLGWSDVPIGEAILERLESDLPFVVDNEANLAALAESRRGTASGLADVLYVAAEVGVGGGIISERRLLRGASGFAGEIGHFPVNLAGQRCNCGAIGCFETEVGEVAMLRRAGRPIDSGRHGVLEVLAAAEEGDPVVLGAMAEHGKWLGIGLAGLINILNPASVVLGGVLGQAHPYLVESMNVELDSRVLAAVNGRIVVAASSLGQDAPLLGAAELAWDRAIEALI